MKKLLYALLTSSMLASTCITHLKAEDTEQVATSAWESIDWKQKCMGLGALTSVLGYGYATCKYGLAQVNGILMGTVALGGGYILGDFMAKRELLSVTAQAFETTYGPEGYEITPMAITTALLAGVLTYKVVYSLIDVYSQSKKTVIYTS